MIRYKLFLLFILKEFNEQLTTLVLYKAKESYLLLTKQAVASPVIVRLNRSFFSYGISAIIVTYLFLLQAAATIGHLKISKYWLVLKKYTLFINQSKTYCTF